MTRTLSAPAIPINGADTPLISQRWQYRYHLTPSDPADDPGCCALQQAFGRSPSIPEIAAHVGLSVEDTIEALDVGDAYRAVSLDAPNDDDTDELSNSAGGSHDPGYAACEARMVLPGLLAMLPSDREREREIIRLRFVDEPSQSQIAARLGLSQVHVSRLPRQSLEQVRSQLLADPRSAHTESGHR
jgi:RNA polymerase sigma-B factor